MVPVEKDLIAAARTIVDGLAARVAEQIGNARAGLPQRYLQRVVDRISNVQFIAVALEQGSERSAGAVDHASTDWVIDPVLSPRPAGVAIRHFTRLADTQAKRGIARVIVRIHSQMVAKCSNITHAQDCVGRKVTLKGKVDMLLI